LIIDLGNIAEKLTQYNLSMNQLLILYCVSYNKKAILDEYTTRIQTLSKDDFMQLIGNCYLLNKNTTDTSIYFSQLEVTNDGQKLLNDLLVQRHKSNTLTWVLEYYELFPKGIKSGGYYIKTDLKGCEKKLLDFLKKNPNFSKENILDATNLYLTEMKQRGYHMCKLAPYFIEKDGISMLAGYCEQVVNKTDSTQKSVGLSEIITNRVEGI
jgi:hypothetical protein